MRRRSQGDGAIPLEKSTNSGITLYRVFVYAATQKLKSCFAIWFKPCVERLGPSTTTHSKLPTIWQTYEWLKERQRKLNSSKMPSVIGIATCDYAVANAIAGKQER